MVLFISKRRKQRQQQLQIAEGQQSPYGKQTYDSVSLVTSNPQIGNAYSALPTQQDVSLRMLKEFEIPFSALKMDRLLGSGNFGTVHLAYYEGFAIACKQLKSDISKPDHKQQVSDFISEAKVLAQIPTHPNVVRFLGISPSPLCILTEFINGPSLVEYIASDQKVTYTVALVMGFLKQIAQAVNHLHSNHIIHRLVSLFKILSYLFFQKTTK